MPDQIGSARGAHTPMAQVAPVAPVAVGDRLGALDAVRGFALLGIFLVNIQGFKAPIGRMFDLLPLPTDTAMDVFVHHLTRIMAEGKFYPLFSMLFGMGMAMQLGRVTRAMRSFTGFYWRRLLVLLLIGLPHMLLLWYGDILIIYSLAGFVVMWFVHARAGTLATVGGALLAFSVVLTLGAGALESLSPPPVPEAALTGDAPVVTAAAEPAGTPLRRFMELMRAGQRVDPSDPRWLAIETEAYQRGPFADTVGFRAITYASMWIFWLIFGGGFPHILAMFCFGAGLLKARIFDDDRSRWWVRFIVVGVLIGVPMCAFNSFAGAWFGEASFVALGAGPALNAVGGPLISLAYLGAIALFVRAAPGAWVVRGLRATGRLALTNYLLQSIVANVLMAHWGMAWFGTISRAEGAAIVVIVFATQVLLSMIWLRAFSIGPAEWLWRSLTYLRPQPVRAAAE